MSCKEVLLGGIKIGTKCNTEPLIIFVSVLVLFLIIIIIDKYFGEK